jgi:hypothetical protein
MATVFLEGPGLAQREQSSPWLDARARRRRGHHRAADVIGDELRRAAGQ